MVQAGLPASGRLERGVQAALPNTTLPRTRTGVTETTVLFTNTVRNGGGAAHLACGSQIQGQKSASIGCSARLRSGAMSWAGRKNISFAVDPTYRRSEDLMQEVRSRDPYPGGTHRMARETHHPLRGYKLFGNAVLNTQAPCC